MSNADGRTHYEGCWEEHNDCARIHLRAALAALRARDAVNLCSVCAGDEPENMPSPCICGGTGTAVAELHGLRCEALRLRSELAALRQRIVNLIDDTFVADPELAGVIKRALRDPPAEGGAR